MAVQLKYERPCTRTEYDALERNPLVVVSYNHDDPNTAGMIRTAEAFRAEKVYFSRKPANMAPAVGIQKWQPVVYERDLLGVLRCYQEAGWQIVALEQTDASCDLTTTVLPERMVLVVGNEGMGVPQDALDLCSQFVVIPQFGFVGSLNVVTAASIALYEWMRQHGKGVR